jgi:hypothetical protein
MAKTTKTRPGSMAGIADRTITQLIAAYLGALSAHRRREAAFGLELLQHCLDGYAYEGLRPAERRLFDRYFNQEGPTHREYCDLFGPEKVVPELGHFLGWFLIRKVLAGPEDRAHIAGETGRFVTWLGEHGHIGRAAAADGAARAARAAELLPKAGEAARILGPTLGSAPEVAGEPIEGSFLVARVAPGKLWLEAWEDGRTYGPLAIPQRASALLSAGWELHGVIAKVGRSWKLLEAWNVYPVLDS